MRHLRTATMAVALALIFVGQADAGPPRYGVGRGNFITKADGTVWTWLGGYPWDVQLRKAFEGGAGLASGIHAVFDLVVGEDGLLYAAGNNAYREYNNCGELGNGTFDTSDSFSPVKKLDGTTLTNVAAAGKGYNGNDPYAVALTKNGRVYHWGCGPGEGPLPAAKRFTSPYLAKGMRVNAIASLGSTLMLREDGTILTWGDYACGGDTCPIVPDSTGKVPLDRVVAIATGGWHHLALRDDGTVWSWGDPVNGALGQQWIWPDSWSRSYIPRPVAGPGGEGILTNIKAIAATLGESFALTNDGHVYAWDNTTKPYYAYGQNSKGQMGTGTREPTPYPTLVQVRDEAGNLSPLSGIVEIYTSTGPNNRAIGDDGNLYEWGYGYAENDPYRINSFLDGADSDDPWGVRDAPFTPGAIIARGGTPFNINR